MLKSLLLEFCSYSHQDFEILQTTPVAVYIYRLNTEGVAEETDEENNTVTCQQWILPAGYSNCFNTFPPDKRS